jgi:ankyrin repeat protein
MALGASPNAIEHGGISSLHLAARRGDEAIIDMLLIRGADATRKSEDGKTPADTAQEGGHSALARLLRTSSAR